MRIERDSGLMASENVVYFSELLRLGIPVVWILPGGSPIRETSYMHLQYNNFNVH